MPLQHLYGFRPRYVVNFKVRKQMSYKAWQCRDGNGNAATPDEVDDVDVDVDDDVDDDDEDGSGNGGDTWSLSSFWCFRGTTKSPVKLWVLYLTIRTGTRTPPPNPACMPAMLIGYTLNYVTIYASFLHPSKLATQIDQMTSSQPLRGQMTSGVRDFVPRYPAKRTHQSSPPIGGSSTLP